MSSVQDAQDASGPAPTNTLRSSGSLFGTWKRKAPGAHSKDAGRAPPDISQAGPLFSGLSASLNASATLGSVGAWLSDGGSDTSAASEPAPALTPVRHSIDITDGRPSTMRERGSKGFRTLLNMMTPKSSVRESKRTRSMADFPSPLSPVGVHSPNMLSYESQEGSVRVHGLRPSADDLCHSFDQAAAGTLPAQKSLPEPVVAVAPAGHDREISSASDLSQPYKGAPDDLPGLISTASIGVEADAAAGAQLDSTSHLTDNTVKNSQHNEINLPSEEQATCSSLTSVPASPTSAPNHLEAAGIMLSLADMEAGGAEPMGAIPMPITAALPLTQQTGNPPAWANNAADHTAITEQHDAQHISTDHVVDCMHVSDAASGSSEAPAEAATPRKASTAAATVVAPSRMLCTPPKFADAAAVSADNEPASPPPNQQLSMVVSPDAAVVAAEVAMLATPIRSPDAAAKSEIRAGMAAEAEYKEVAARPEVVKLAAAAQSAIKAAAEEVADTEALSCDATMNHLSAKNAAQQVAAGASAQFLVAELSAGPGMAVASCSPALPAAAEELQLPSGAALPHASLAACSLAAGTLGTLQAEPSDLPALPALLAGRLLQLPLQDTLVDTSARPLLIAALPAAGSANLPTSPGTALALPPTPVVATAPSQPSDPDLQQRNAGTGLAVGFTAELGVGLTTELPAVVSAMPDTGPQQVEQVATDGGAHCHGMAGLPAAPPLREGDAKPPEAGPAAAAAAAAAAAFVDTSAESKVAAASTLPGTSPEVSMAGGEVVWATPPDPEEGQPERMQGMYDKSVHMTLLQHADAASARLAASPQEPASHEAAQVHQALQEHALGAQAAQGCPAGVQVAARQQNAAAGSSGHWGVATSQGPWPQQEQRRQAPPPCVAAPWQQQQPTPLPAASPSQTVPAASTEPMATSPAPTSSADHAKINLMAIQGLLDLNMDDEDGDDTFDCGLEATGTPVGGATMGSLPPLKPAPSPLPQLPRSHGGVRASIPLFVTASYQMPDALDKHLLDEVVPYGGTKRRARVAATHGQSVLDVVGEEEPGGTTHGEAQPVHSMPQPAPLQDLPASLLLQSGPSPSVSASISKGTAAMHSPSLMQYAAAVTPLPAGSALRRPAPPQRTPRTSASGLGEPCMPLFSAAKATPSGARMPGLGPLTGTPPQRATSMPGSSPTVPAAATVPVGQRNVRPVSANGLQPSPVALADARAAAGLLGSMSLPLNRAGSTGDTLYPGGAVAPARPQLGSALTPTSGASRGAHHPAACGDATQLWLSAMSPPLDNAGNRPDSSSCGTEDTMDLAREAAKFLQCMGGQGLGVRAEPMAALAPVLLAANELVAASGPGADLAALQIQLLTGHLAEAQERALAAEAQIKELRDNVAVLELCAAEAADDSMERQAREHLEMSLQEEQQRSADLKRDLHAVRTEAAETAAALARQHAATEAICIEGKHREVELLAQLKAAANEKDSLEAVYKQRIEQADDAASQAEVWVAAARADAQAAQAAAATAELALTAARADIKELQAALGTKALEVDRAHRAAADAETKLKATMESVIMAQTTVKKQESQVQDLRQRLVRSQAEQQTSVVSLQAERERAIKAEENIVRLVAERKELEGMCEYLLSQAEAGKAASGSLTAR